MAARAGAGRIGTRRKDKVARIVTGPGPKLALLDLDNFLCCLMLFKETEFRFHPHCSYVVGSSVALCLQLRSPMFTRV